MRLVILEAIEILVSLLANVTFVGFLLLHALRARVGRLRVWVHNGEGPITVFV